MLSKNPDFAFTGAFKDLVSKHIGSGNKFVLMDNLGRMTTINQNSGYYWSGLWLSNTYAWSAPMTISDTFIKNHKQWKRESKSEIVKYSGYKYSGYGYDDYDWKTYNGSSNKDLLDINLNDAEHCIQDLIYLGYYELEVIELDDIENFLAVNQLQDIYNLYDKLNDDDITSTQFMDYIYNPSRYQMIKTSKMFKTSKEEKTA
jgi:hypothetical protein